MTSTATSLEISSYSVSSFHLHTKDNCGSCPCWYSCNWAFTINDTHAFRELLSHPFSVQLHSNIQNHCGSTKKEHSNACHSLTQSASCIYMLPSYCLVLTSQVATHPERHILLSHFNLMHVPVLPIHIFDLIIAVVPILRSWISCMHF